MSSRDEPKTRTIAENKPMTDSTFKQYTFPDIPGPIKTETPYKGEYPNRF